MRRLIPWALWIPVWWLVFGASSWGAPPDPASVPTSAEEIRPLLIGAPVPEVTLRTADGSSVELGRLVTQKPTVLIFYRGGW